MKNICLPLALDHGQIFNYYSEELTVFMNKKKKHNVQAYCGFSWSSRCWKEHSSI